MEQRRRPGGNGGKGKYTSWEKNKTNLCIYCGVNATTREHIPSKAFLQEPYPHELPTIPACFECNNGFSKDEKYLSYYFEKLKTSVMPHIYTSDIYLKKLGNDMQLKLILDREIKIDNGEILYSIDEERLEKILIKLARGHAGFEVDYLNFNDSYINCEYEFIFNLSQGWLTDFENLVLSEKVPEVGSRGIDIIQNIGTGAAAYLSDWKIVQENQYRYQVSMNEDNGYIVKIIFSELLYAKVYLP